MTRSDWIASAAAVAAFLGVAVALWALVYARRSAAEARRLRELEADRREEERQRWHEELGPDLPGEIVAEFRPHPRLGAGMGSLWGKVSFPKTYRVKAVARMGQSRTDLSVPMLVERGQTVDFEIELWHPDQERAKTDEIVFKVWPPVRDADDTPAWSCGCGRPTGESLDGEGHWGQRVKVIYEKPQGPFVAFR